jgi:hypothetical protein
MWKAFKENGNREYSNGNYDAAIAEYTKAIQHRGDVDPILFTNRALAYLRSGSHSHAELDALRALEAKSGHVKAHYVLGRCAVVQEMYGEGAKRFRKALDLCEHQNSSGSMLPDIFDCYYSARRALFHAEHAAQLACFRDLMDRICNDSAALPAAPLLEQLLQVAKDSKGLIQRMVRPGAANGGSAVAGSESLTSVPESFLCPITWTVMCDPVIFISASRPRDAYSSVSYDRPNILEHFRVNGYFDPITRVDLGPEIPVLVPNVTLRNAIQEFLESHPWIEF